MRLKFPVVLGYIQKSKAQPTSFCSDASHARENKAMEIQNGIGIGTVACLLDALNCGAALIDRTGTILHVNPRLYAMLRLPCAQLTGRRVADLYESEQDRAMVLESLQHFDEHVEREFHLPLPDGQRLPVISSAKPLPPPLADVRVITMIDISRQKQAEQSLQERHDFIVQMSDTVLQQALDLKHYSQQLEQRVQERTAQLEQAQMDAIFMLAVASEAKDQDTGRHVLRIRKYAQELARRLGFSERESLAIGYSSILHDVGKIHIPDEILTKPGPLDDSQRRHMQQHTIAGERIISTHAFFERARHIARSHHENWDGSGYPDGASKDSIPIDARIVHLVDVYDALTHARVYKKAWPKPRAVEEIHAETGKMFDPEVVRAFDQALRSGAIQDADDAGARIG
jgi:PAS domain S-box-containing protein/putative nucleotidyltransferase with HDIG domain